MQKEFFNHGILTVPRAEFDGLNKSFVRVRMPVEEEFPQLLEAVKAINLGR